jgi:hypothetical protein
MLSTMCCDFVSSLFHSRDLKVYDRAKIFSVRLIEGSLSFSTISGRGRAA